MRRALAALLIASASTAAAFACSTFGTSEDVAPDAATTTDAPASATPPPAPPPPAPPLDAGSDGTVFFDDFEDGDCSAYTGFVANVDATDVAHAGKHACLICRTGDAGRPQAYRSFEPSAAPGKYSLSYEARLVDAGPARGATATFVLSYDAGDQAFTGATFQITSSTWVPVNHADMGTAPDPVGGRAIVLGDVAELEGECFAFDEVRMVYTP